MIRHFKHLWQNVAGVAYLEFALSLPFLLILFGGSIDVSRMVLLHQKVEKATFTAGDLLSQQIFKNTAADVTTCRAFIDNVLRDRVIRDIMLPYSVNAGDYSFSMTAHVGANGNRREWTRGSAGAAPLSSYLGRLANGERVIVTRINYRFTQLMPDIIDLGEGRFTKHTYHRVRTNYGATGFRTGVLGTC